MGGEGGGDKSRVIRLYICTTMAAMIAIAVGAVGLLVAAYM